jgi:hypothetical protein
MTSRPDLPALAPERVQAPRVASMLGISLRQVQDMAARGEIPTAARFGARWTFDECALYDATMEGPRFKGWNRSALDRLRPKVRGFVADMLALDATTPAGERG